MLTSHHHMTQPYTTSHKYRLYNKIDAIALADDNIVNKDVYCNATERKLA
jgi:hypothetical protein